MRTVSATPKPLNALADLREDEPPPLLSGKYNLALVDGEWVYIMLDEAGVPLGTPMPVPGKDGARNAWRMRGTP